MKIGQQTKVFIVLFFVLLLVFQNCTTALDFSSKSAPKKPLSSGAQEGGGNFDGKPEPGDYVRTFPDFSCPASPEFNSQARMTVSATKASVITDNCIAKNYETTFDNPKFIFSKYNAEYLLLSNAIFRKVENINSPINLITEVFCRGGSPTKFIDVAIRRTTENLSAKIYVDVKGDHVVVPDFPIVKGSTGNETSFTSQVSDFSLSVSNVSDNDRNFSGSLTTSIDSNNYVVPVVCQRMDPMPIFNLSLSSLMLYYKFDEDVLVPGQTIHDASGNGLNGTITFFSGPITNTIGLAGKAIPFGTQPAPVSNNIKFPGMLAPAVVASMSLWYSRPSTQSRPNVIASFGTKSGLGLWESLAIWSYNNSGWKSRYRGMITNVSDTSLSNNTWHHLALTIDNSTVRMYLDGTLNLQAARDPATLGLDLLDSADLLWLGSVYDNNAIEDVNNGTLDELSVWRRVLTPAEIQGIYNNKVLY